MGGKKNSYRKADRRAAQIECEPLKIIPGCRKVRYETHGAASYVRRVLYKKSRKEKKNGGLLNVYFCTTCDGWHVGHDKPWIKGPRS